MLNAIDATSSSRSSRCRWMGGSITRAMVAAILISAGFAVVVSPSVSADPSGCGSDWASPGASCTFADGGGPHRAVVSGTGTGSVSVTLSGPSGTVTTCAGLAECRNDEVADLASGTYTCEVSGTGPGTYRCQVVDVSAPTTTSMPPVTTTSVPFPGIPDAGVIVFAGDASTSDLCYPSDPLNACGNFGSLTGADGVWSFEVPGSPIATPAGNLPSTCNALGVFGAQTAIPSGDPGNCTIDADGVLTPAIEISNQGGLVPPLPPGSIMLAGPGCGISHGETTLDDDVVTVDGVPGLGIITAEWIASAGGTLPISGTLSNSTADLDLTYVGVMQARPIAQNPQSTPCLTEPANTFTVVGVIAAMEL